MSEPEELLSVAVDGARTAGALLLERARGGAEREVASKSTPTDLVSEADLEAERAIRELIHERRPDDGFVGEESPGEEGSSGLTWVVDPLDGTSNFLFAIPQWCVSVAVRDETGVLAGAVYDPNRDELFIARRGARAELIGPDGTLELRAGEEAPAAPMQGRASASVRAAGLNGAMVATGLAYDARVRSAQAVVLSRLVPRVRDIRRFGSAALDLTWTAAGRYDAYFERSVKQWDIAAGVLICEQAGLSVFELPALENLPWGILVAPPALAEQLLELVVGA